MLTAVACCLVLLPDRLRWVANDRDIGHADRAAYALQGRSLATGRGLQVPYVSNFFRSYPRTIWRNDDHWPPLLAFFLAPAFRCYGVEVAVAKQVTITIGTLLLPLAAAWLAWEATARAWAALAGALLMLASTQIAVDSAAVLSDLLLAAVVASCCASILATRRHPAWFLAAGVLAALAWYAKGSQIILLGFLPVAAVLLHGFRAAAWRWVAGGVVAFLVVVSPRWIYNARWFGNPLHSTQNYAAAFFGLADQGWDDWEKRFLGVYWNHHLPRPTDRFRAGIRFRDSVLRNTRVFARVLLLGPDANDTHFAGLGRLGAAVRRSLSTDVERQALDAKAQEKSARSSAPTRLIWSPGGWRTWYFALPQTLGVVWGSCAVLAWPLATCLMHTRRRRVGDDPAADADRAPEWKRHVDAGAVLFLLLLGEAAFVIIFWQAMTRLAIVIVPLALTLGFLVPVVVTSALPGGLAGLLRDLLRPAEPSPSTRVLATVLLCLLAFNFWLVRSEDLMVFQHKRYQTQPEAGEAHPWVSNLARQIETSLPPDSVIMTRVPWELLFYLPDTFRAVALPYAPPAVILGVARHYGVTHLGFDRDRPGLRAFIESGHPALRLVIDGANRVFAIDFSRFAPAEIDDPSQWPPSRPLWEDGEALRAGGS